MPRRSRSEGEENVEALGHVIAGRINAQYFSSEDASDDIQQAFGQIGLYLPHLCLRYLFQIRCLPLERFLLIEGPPGVNKSSFLFWLYYLFRLNSGNFLHLHTEGKDTSDLRLSILKYDAGAGWTCYPKTLDELFNLFKEKLDWLEGEVYPKSKVKDEIPLIIGIDSLSATLSEETIRRFESNRGVPERRYSTEALKLTDWFRGLYTRLHDKPYFVAAINHEKQKTTPMGLPSYYVPGGIAQSFHASYKLQMAKLGEIKQTAKGWQGNSIKLKMIKNSFGTTNVSINADIIWKTEKRISKKGKSYTYQVTIWNWYKGTAELLVALSKTPTPAGKYVKEKIKIEKYLGKYRAKGIGIDEYTDAISFSNVFENNYDVLDELEPLLGIHNAIPFKAGTSYESQKEQARKYVHEAYQDIEPVGEITNPDSEDAVVIPVENPTNGEGEESLEEGFNDGVTDEQGE